MTALKDRARAAMGWHMLANLLRQHPRLAAFCERREDAVLTRIATDIVTEGIAAGVRIARSRAHTFYVGPVGRA